MVTTRVDLTPEQVEALRKLATERGVAVTDLIREAVDRILHEREAQERRRRALEVVGQFSGPADLSARHDDYLAEGST